MINVFATATEHLAHLRRGDYSPVELLDAHFAQVDSHNPRLNAVIWQDRERARQAVARLDRVNNTRPLLGLSMTNVEMEIDDIDIDFFRKFTKDVIVVVKMKGLKGGQPWIDDRTIRLHKIGSKWTIVELMPEKRKVNG